MDDLIPINSCVPLILEPLIFVHLRNPVICPPLILANLIDIDIDIFTNVILVKFSMFTVLKC